MILNSQNFIYAIPLKKKKIHIFHLIFFFFLIDIFHLILLNYAFLFFSKLGSEFQTKFQIGVVT